VAAKHGFVAHDDRESVRIGDLPVPTYDLRVAGVFAHDGDLDDVVVTALVDTSAFVPLSAEGGEPDDVCRLAHACEPCPDGPATCARAEVHVPSAPRASFDCGP
jgi:hypothetical protein